MEKKKYPLRLCKGFISLMGWITHSDTYEWYLMYIKPLISVRAVKRIISKMDKEANKNARMENRDGSPAILFNVLKPEHLPVTFHFQPDFSKPLLNEYNRHVQLLFIIICHREIIHIPDKVCYFQLALYQKIQLLQEKVCQPL